MNYNPSWALLYMAMIDGKVVENKLTFNDGLHAIAHAEELKLRGNYFKIRIVPMKVERGEGNG